MRGPRLTHGVQVVVGAEVGDGPVQAAVAVQCQLALVERGQLLAAHLVARVAALHLHGRLVVCRGGRMVAQCVLAGACRWAIAELGAICINMGVLANKQRDLAVWPPQRRLCR